MNNFGVAFSGGGYRAAIYHIGTLRALHNLKLLNKIDVLCTNSGGSITGAYYCLYKDSKPYEDIESELKAALDKSVLNKILFHWRAIFGYLIFIGLLFLSCYSLVFEKQVWLTPICLMVSIYFIFKFHFSLFPFGKLLESAYSNILFGKKTMSDLSRKPLIVINATNLETGKLWIFNQSEMKDTTYEYGKEKATFLPEMFPISRAVASSSCVPFAFTPIAISKEYLTDEYKDSKIAPRLVDGGVYDNQGIHKLVQENSKYNCKHVIVSDAGYTFPFGGIQKNQFTVLIKVMDILMLRIKNQQMINAVYENTIKGNRQIGYFSLGWEIETVIPAFVKNFKNNLLTQSVIEAHELKDKSTLDESQLCEYMKTKIGYDSIVSKVVNPSVLKNRLNVSTNLKPLTFDQSNALILHAEIMCTLFVKLHCPSLISNTNA